MLTASEFNWLLTDLQQAERHNKEGVPALRMQITDAYEDALDEIEKLQRLTAWSRPNRPDAQRLRIEKLRQLNTVARGISNGLLHLLGARKGAR